MAGELNGRLVAILAADGVERVELEQPRQALDQAGARTTLLSIHDGEIAARNHDLEDAGTFAVDQLVGDAAVDDYDALLLPGGTVNPDKLRMEPAACRGCPTSRRRTAARSREDGGRRRCSTRTGSPPIAEPSTCSTCISGSTRSRRTSWRRITRRWAGSSGGDEFSPQPRSYLPYDPT